MSKYKKIIFLVLSYLPKSIGDFVYNQFWSIYNIQKQARINRLFSRTKIDSISILELKSQFEVSTDSIIELGSGWFPFLPNLILKKEKDLKIYTFDINKFYSKSRVKIANRLTGFNNLGLLENIKYFPNCDCAVFDFDLSKIFEPLIISRHVLQHIPTQKLIDIHKNFIKHFNRHKIIYLINTSDLRSHYLEEIGPIDFLEFNSLEWESKVLRFEYCNRLRLPQYTSIFQELGYEIKYLDFSIAGIENINFGQLREKINEEFTEFTNEELFAHTITIVLQYGKT
jgi:hypothetical protein